MNNEIRFTLDNLTYTLVVNSSEELSFVLPRRIPSVAINETKKNVIKPAEQTTIKVFAKVQANPVPAISVISEDEDVKITITGSLELLPDSTSMITFTTTDGGNTWLISSSIAAAATAEEAEQIAKNAQTIAVDAKTVATSAQETANTAKTSADTATTTANTAKTSADTAVLTAKQAQTDAVTATQAAQTATSEAKTAKETAEAAQTTADEANESAIMAQSAAEDAVTTAGEALGEAQIAKSTAETAKTTADGAIQKESTTAQTIKSDVILGNGKKFFVQKADGDTPLAFAVNKYSTGLEQFEVGTSKLPLCLNHCTNTIGEEIDKHVKVEYKDTVTDQTYKEKVAYLSDVEANKEALESEMVKLATEGTQTIDSHVAVAKNKKFLLTTKDGVNQINGIAVNNYDDIGLEQVEVGSTTVPMCLNHCGTTEEDIIDKHIRVDCKETPTSPIIKEQLAYLSDLPDTTKFITTTESEDTQTVNSNFAVGAGKRGLVTKQDGTTINSVSVIHYDTGLEQVEVGSATMPMCLNHSGTEDGTIDKHINVDCRETPESSVVKEQIAYLSDLVAQANQLVKLISETAQTINSDIALASGKKLFLTDALGHQYNGIQLGSYETGLTQTEIGSASMPLCLNHCGTDVGETIDGHIRVDYKNTVEDSVKHDSLAYMSDIEELLARIEALEAKVQ